MSVAQQFDIGRYILSVPALAPATVNSSAGAAQNGVTIDRQAYSRQFHSVQIAALIRLAGSTVQASTVTVGLQHSSDGSSWDNYSTGRTVSRASGSTSATGAQTVNDVAQAGFSLQNCRRYIRAVVTPAFAATTSGDSVALSAIANLGGANELPATS